MAQATAHPNHQLISSEDVEGTEVYDNAGKNIGEIDHLMIDKVSGRVGYAVMSFGGFMGLGHSHYPVPWGALKYDTSLGGFRTNITEQQLKDAPQFSDDSWGRPGLGDAHAPPLRCEPELLGPRPARCLGRPGLLTFEAVNILTAFFSLASIVRFATRRSRVLLLSWRRGDAAGRWDPA